MNELKGTEESRREETGREKKPGNGDKGEVGPSGTGDGKVEAELGKRMRIEQGRRG